MRNIKNNTGSKAARKGLAFILIIILVLTQIFQGIGIIALLKGGNRLSSVITTNIVNYNNTTSPVTTNSYSSSVSVQENSTDAKAPEIIDVHAMPPIQLVGNNVTIICKVIDDFTIECVKVNITGPSGFARINITMGKSANTYYYKDTYSILGNYSYYIWANDSNNNAVCSAVNQFQIVYSNLTFSANYTELAFRAFTN